MSGGAHPAPSNDATPAKAPSAEAPPAKAPGSTERVTLLALMISFVALSIDAMLPALPQIGSALGVARENDNSLIISTLFVGLAIGQIIYGPLSDSLGRKPAIHAGMLVFLAGCLISIFSRNLEVMLLGRFLQGLGAAGPRIVTLALVRDQFEGRAMARVMSLVMAVFIMVPALAPLVGQGILFVAGWRAIFYLLLALGLVALVWFFFRQPETLAPRDRVPLSLTRIFAGVRETCLLRASIGYTVAAGLMFGAFVGYLSSSQQIFQVHYDLGALFPLFFAILALAIGSASVTNARLVMRYGMRRLSAWALYALTLLSLGFLVITLAMAGNPPLLALMLYLTPAFFCIGILFGNFNALAMEPLGHIAGVAAAVIGSLTTFISLFFGLLISQAYDDTLLPLVGGFAGLGIAAVAVIHWTEAGSGQPADE